MQYFKKKLFLYISSNPLCCYCGLHLFGHEVRSSRYLVEKDVEDVLFTMGLNISRGHVQKLVKKFAAREKVNYRYLTDSWINKDGTVTYSPGVAPDAPSLSVLSKGAYSYAIRSLLDPHAFVHLFSLKELFLQKSKQLKELNKKILRN